MKEPQDRADAGESTTSPRLRLKLSTAEDARRELARVYREARSGRLEVGDASRLANILQILVRCIETSDIEARVIALEKLNDETPKRAGNGGRGARLRSA